MAKVQKLTFPISKLPIAKAFPSLDNSSLVPNPIWILLKDSSKSDAFVGKAQTKLKK